jgi:N-acetylglutamate synthase/N-acetylornithine aminotransferase
LCFKPRWGRLIAAVGAENFDWEQGEFQTPLGAADLFQTPFGEIGLHNEMLIAQIG